jgi:hypothetical protein
VHMLSAGPDGRPAPAPLPDCQGCGQQGTNRPALAQRPSTAGARRPHRSPLIAGHPHMGHSRPSWLWLGSGELDLHCTRDAVSDERHRRQ